MITSENYYILVLLFYRPGERTCSCLFLFPLNSMGIISVNPQRTCLSAYIFAFKVKESIPAAILAWNVAVLIQAKLPFVAAGFK